MPTVLIFVLEQDMCGQQHQACPVLYAVAAVIVVLLCVDQTMQRYEVCVLRLHCEFWLFSRHSKCPFPVVASQTVLSTVLQLLWSCLDIKADAWCAGVNESHPER